MFVMKRLVIAESPFDSRLRGGVLDLGLADAGRVDVGLVRQVHQVVDHQPVVALDVIEAAAVRPVGAVGPGQRMHQRRIGGALLARPDPDKAVRSSAGYDLIVGRTRCPGMLTHLPSPPMTRPW
jgi:hypothetical protein